MHVCVRARVCARVCVYMCCHMFDLCVSVCMYYSCIGACVSILGNMITYAHIPMGLAHITNTSFDMSHLGTQFTSFSFKM